jgi:hypothetical protein
MAITNGPMAGKGMKVTYNSVFVEGVESFTLNTKGGTAETTAALTDSSLANKSFIGTLREWSGSIKLKYVNFANAPVLALWNAVGATAPVAAVFYPDAATSFVGTIVVTGFDVDQAIDGVAGGSVSFTGSGTLVPTAV